MDRRIWHPAEIIKSLGELLLRAALSLWAILTVLVAGIAAVLERVSPGTHVSDRLWFKIAIGGAVVSVAWAYHRTRLERDRAHAKDVRGDHLEELQRRLTVLLGNVQSGGWCEYDDAPDGRGTHRNMFRAHYPELAVSLDEWDAAVKRATTAQRRLSDALGEAVITEDETAAWHGINGDDYDIHNVIEVIHRVVIERAEKGELGQGAVLRPWDFRNPLPDPPGAPPTQAMWVVVLGERRIAQVPDLPEEGRDERLRAVKRRVEALWKAAEGWEVAPEIAASKRRLGELERPLVDDLQEWRKASGVRVTHGCSICRKNEGWPNPQPPLWRHGLDRMRRLR
jgi:hypothetical protein